MAVRVLISDDHPLVRQSLQYLLSREPDTESFATVEGQPAILETLYNHDVDVVILNMRDQSVSEAPPLRQMLWRLPEVKLIVMSLHTDRHYVDESFYMGAAGYLVKSSAFEELPDAFRCVLKGNRYISRDISGVPECRPIRMA
jgi:DNA-binding NarL/FixJ family response regulator